MNLTKKFVSNPTYTNNNSSKHSVVLKIKTFYTVALMPALSRE